MRTEIAMITEIHEINRKIAELKPAFEAYIKNQDYPLDERWSAFCQANDTLKNHMSYVQRFNSLGDTNHGDRAIGYDCWLRHVERYELVDIKDIIESAECYNEERDDPDMRVVDVDALKEEILSRNLGSYEYDW